MSRQAQQPNSGVDGGVDPFGTGPASARGSVSSTETLVGLSRPNSVEGQA